MHNPCSTKVKYLLILGLAVALFPVRAHAGRLTQAVDRVVNRVERHLRHAGGDTRVAVLYRPQIGRTGPHGEVARQVLVERLASQLRTRSGFVFYHDPLNADRKVREIFQLIEVAKNISNPSEQHRAIEGLRRAVAEVPYRYFVDTTVWVEDSFLIIEAEVFSSSGSTTLQTHEKVRLSTLEGESPAAETTFIYLQRFEQGADFFLERSGTISRSPIDEGLLVYGVSVGFRSPRTWSELYLLVGSSEDRDVQGFDYRLTELAFEMQGALWEGRLGGIWIGAGARLRRRVRRGV